MRLSAVTTMGTPKFASTLTFAGEHSILRDRTAGEITMAQYEGRDQMEDPGQPRDVITWSSNSGVSAQANVALLDALYVTAGVRGERVGQWRGLSQSSTLPLLGGALVHDFPRVTVKLRGAYGKGIRTPRNAAQILTHEGRYTLENPSLAPEEQSGTEFGTDLIMPRGFGLHVTRFDQTASGLIQTVIVDSTSSGGPGERPVYQLQNVGEIINRGWEAQASLALRSLSLASAVTFVDSRVRRLAVAYTGDLRPGDRMLGVPARTLSATAAWTSRAFRISSTLSRASDWVNYDRLALADTLIKLGSTGWNTVIGGAKLRQFWINYPGSTRLRASMARDLPHGFTLTLTGENLLNYQRGEPDSITIVPGRTLSLGLRARF
jgi:iron complex outermembrane receptor protein